MRRNLAVIIGAMLVLGAFAGPVIAQDEDPPQEERAFQANTTGSATSAETGTLHDLDVNVSGNITVTESGEGVDETAFTPGLNVTANVTLDGDLYEIPVTVAGEGTSLEQAGVVDSEAWNLYAQGQALSQEQDGHGPASGEEQQQPDQARFNGNLTLVGSDGGFLVEGSGTLTVITGDDATSYHLDYRGEATFE